MSATRDTPSGDPARLGFGCASLYGLPGKRERREVLERAYEMGIRHFDVAPIYGLGIAESELGEFAVHHPDITIATKFGIKPTAFGRAVGLAQAPVRRVLRRSSRIAGSVKRSGARPNAGVVGRALYSAHSYTAAAARRSLEKSLCALKVDRLDYYFLHEPAGQLGSDSAELIDYLESAVSRGVIGYWGPAGDLTAEDPQLRVIVDHGTAHQMPYDLLGGFGGPPLRPDTRAITFGFLSRAFHQVRHALRARPELTRRCAELLDTDLADDRQVVHLLIRDALTNNSTGTVLMSSTKPANLAFACAAARATLPNEARAAELIRQRCLEAKAVR